MFLIINDWEGTCIVSTVKEVTNFRIIRSILKVSSPPQNGPISNRHSISCVTFDFSSECTNNWGPKRARVSMIISHDFSAHMGDNWGAFFVPPFSHSLAQPIIAQYCINPRSQFLSHSIHSNETWETLQRHTIIWSYWFAKLAENITRNSVWKTIANTIRFKCLWREVDDEWHDQWIDDKEDAQDVFFFRGKRRQTIAGAILDVFTPPGLTL